jgi:hypothetical protein
VGGRDEVLHLCGIVSPTFHDVDFNAWKVAALTCAAAVIPPTIYYSRVGLELTKIMFKGQKMAPP